VIFPSKISYNQRLYSSAEHNHVGKSYAALFSDHWKAGTLRDMDHLGRVITHAVWSPIIFSGSYRNKAAYQSSDWFGLDFDGGYTLDQALNDWCDTVCIIGTTRSHQKQKDEQPPCDRFRIVGRFERTITSCDEYEHNMRKLVERYEADGACVDGARLFYPCTEIVGGCDDGFLQPVEEAPANAPAKLAEARIARQVATGIVPNDAMYFLKCKITTGNRNKAMYKAAKDLFRCGKPLDEVIHLIEASPTYRDCLTPLLAKEIQDTVISALGALQRKA
jgi:hypothetical protein